MPSISSMRKGESSQPRWWRRSGFALRLMACYCAVTLATVFVAFFKRTETGANLIWVANGLLLAYLLLAPRWRWPAYIAAGSLALATGSALLHEEWRMILLYNLLNPFEILFAAYLLRRRSFELPSFTDVRYLVRFIGIAVFTGPAISGILLAIIQGIRIHAPFWPTVVDWIAGDGLGAAVVTPTVVAIFQIRIRRSAISSQDWILPWLLFGATFAAFSQSRLPILFLLYPLLVLVLLRYGLGWAALAAFFVAVTGSWYTLHGVGPFVLAKAYSPSGPGVLLQMYVASAMFMLYSVSVVMEGQRSTERKLRDIAALHSLVTDNSRDVILLADLDGRRTYVSSAVQRLTGWKPEELVSRRFVEIAHPEDQPRVDAIIRDLRSGTEGAIIEYRIRRRNGEYIWIEASLRVYRDPGTGIPAGILNLVRDISERKYAQDQLQQAYKALESLAVVDALTGVANRRRFDESLTSEWRRAIRIRRPLSLLLIDADHFKLYNDTYGHLRGDTCLKQIAEKAVSVVTRTSDLVARYGGEEFAVILPDTENEAAEYLAAEICIAVRELRLPHSANPHGVVTISIGCATMAPEGGLSAAAIVELADQALYRAKRQGRNRICNGNSLPVTGEVLPVRGVSDQPESLREETGLPAQPEFGDVTQ